MFETSLIDLEARKHPRRKWAPLPIALALHGAVLASVALAQVWNVAEVGDPEIVRPYVVSLVPAMESTGSRPRTEVATKPEVPREPVQPVTVPATTPSPAPQPSPGPVLFEGPRNFSPTEGPVSDDPWFHGGPPSDRPKLVLAEPVAAPVEESILFVGGKVLRPLFLSGRPPQYTQVALRTRIEGDVILQAVISDKGRVLDLRVLRGLPMGLDEAALDAVRDWTFEPAKLDGRPVKVYYNLTVAFRIKG